MNIIQLYQDFNIPFATEGKNCIPGWVNIQCPFCGDTSNHLGYNLKQDYFHCWKCGWHPTYQTISKLINVDEFETRVIIRKYGILIPKPTKEHPVHIRAKAHRLPSETTPLMENHKRYLEGRKFDPERLEREWNLVGTGPVSLLDGIDYKHRIIAPILWDGQQVSFQGRDITNKSIKRYLACPKDRELIHHKHILYGKQETWSSTGICTEGITDVWRFGVRAFCTFGIEYTAQQVRVIARNFHRIAVIFDDEPQAIVQANKLVSELKFRGVDAWRVDVVGDPGAMKQDEADYLIKQII